MKAHIFYFNEDSDTSEELLIHHIRTEEGKDAVVIEAWHDKGEDGSFYQVEQVMFPSPELAEAFVNDFSYESALTFVNNYLF